MPAEPSGSERLFKTMTCVTCARRLPWPDCFPERIYAECWRCCWATHDRRHHAPKRRRWWQRTQPTHDDTEVPRDSRHVVDGRIAQPSSTERRPS